MNHIIINKLPDLQGVLNESIHITGSQHLMEEETYNNMWTLTLSETLIQSIQFTDLKQFFCKLLENRNLQLLAISPALQATFYIWFDTQALQLRFNIVSGIGTTLPFNCNINLLSSPDPILQDFIRTGRLVTTQGDSIEFLDLDEKFNDEPEQEYTLNVYATTLGSFEKESCNSN